MASLAVSCGVLISVPPKRRPSSSFFSLNASFKSSPLAFSSSSTATSLSFNTPKNLHLPSFLGHHVEKQQRQPRGRLSLVVRAADGAPTTTVKKADQAAKRARQNEKRRIYHKSHKSEIRTRMKKVFESLLKLKKNKEAKSEDIIPIEKLIAEAYSIIDKSVKVGTLHRNTGAHRKSRLARRKKAVEIHHGWYTPAATV